MVKFGGVKVEEGINVNEKDVFGHNFKDRVFSGQHHGFGELLDCDRSASMDLRFNSNDHHAESDRIPLGDFFPLQLGQCRLLSLRILTA
jgi:hypothetical protein